MSATLQRHSKLEIVEVAPQSGSDDQGKPSYAAPASILARVVRGDTIVRVNNGEDVRTVATIWVDGEQVPLPQMDDKLTCEDGLIGIVVERMDGRSLQFDELDHVRVRIREV